MDWSYIFFSAGEYGVILPAAIFCLFPVRSHLKTRLSPTLFLGAVSAGVVITCLLLGTWQSFHTQLESHYTSMLPIFAIALLLYFYFVQTDKLKLFYVFTCAIALFSFSGMANYITEAMLKPDGSYLAPSSLGLPVQWFSILLGMGLFLLLFSRRFTWVIDHFHERSVWRTVWLFPAIIAACNIYMVPRKYSTMHVGRVFYVALFIEGTLLILFFLYQALFLKTAHAVTERAEMEKENQMLEMQASQYASLQSYVTQTSRLRHDFRHTVRTITALAEQKEYGRLLEYLNDYNRQLTDSDASRFCYCSHLAANAVLAYYGDIAAKQRIPFLCEADLPSSLSVSDVDLCVILGNLMENAIQGSLTIPPADRYIRLSIDMEDPGELYILLTHRFEGFIQERDGMILSSRENGHGIGLSSIRATAEKYHGVALFEYKEQEFSASIMLKLTTGKL